MLELGPGPGTNFKCMFGNDLITEWVGVEPNTYFRAPQADMIIHYNISFPTRTVWLEGENEDIDVGSYSFNFIFDF